MGYIHFNSAETWATGNTKELSCFNTKITFVAKKKKKTVQEQQMKGKL